MATKLIKPVSRETLSIEGRKKRPIVVTLVPGDVISFRVKGSRTTTEIYLGHCYVLSQIISADQRFKKKVEEYNAKKKSGRIAKRPKKPFLPYSKMYFDAIK